MSGFLGFLQNLQNTGVLQGLTNFGGTLAAESGPGLQNHGQGLGDAFRAFGPGMLQGQEQILAGQEIGMQRQRNEAFQSAFGAPQADENGQPVPLSQAATQLQSAVPAPFRGIIGALGPEAGSRLVAGLLAQQMDPTRFLKDVNGIPVDIRTGQPIIPHEQLAQMFPERYAPQFVTGGDYSYLRNPTTGALSPVVPGQMQDMGGGIPLNVQSAAEGTGQNPYSSANGIGQFTNGTKIEFLKALGEQASKELNDPGVARAAQLAGGTPDQQQAAIGAWGMNPNLQKWMMGKYQAVTNNIVDHTLQNEQPTDADYRIGYVLRGNAPALIKAARENPNQPVTDILPGDIINANRRLFINRDGSPATAGQAFQNFGADVLRARIAAAVRPNPFRNKLEDTMTVQGPDGPVIVPKSQSFGLPSPGAPVTSVNLNQGAEGNVASINTGPPNTAAGYGTAGIGAGPPPVPAAGGGGSHGSQGGDTPQKDIDAIQQAQQNLAQFDPRYLQTLPKVGQRVNTEADRLGIATPAMQQSLADYTKWKQNVVAGSVQRMHDLFGARLTPTEQSAAAPSMPGLSDSPTEFVAKQQQTIDKATRALQRSVWFETHGLQLNDQTAGKFAVDDMPKFIGQEVQRYAKTLATQGLPEPVIAQRVLQWTGQNFGIVPSQLQDEMSKIIQGAQ